MDILDHVRKQEAQSCIRLTDDEREQTAAFFSERMKEARFFAQASEETEKDYTTSATPCHELREDVTVPFPDGKTLISLSPDNDGTFIRTPRTL